MEAGKLEDVAIVIRPGKDNVAVVTADFIEKDTPLKYEGNVLTVSGRALRGQSFAIKPIRRGQPYMTLGDPIGLASRSVKPGEPIDASNLHSRLPRLTTQYQDNPKRTRLDPKLSSLTFDGFVRPDGEVGIRNLVGIVTSGMCSSTEVREIATRANREIYSREKFPNVDGVVPIIHESGCGMPDGEAVTILNQLLTNTLRHPTWAHRFTLTWGAEKRAWNARRRSSRIPSPITTAGS